LEDAEAPFPEGDDMEQAQLRHVPFDDLGERTDVVRRRRRADFLAFADGANAERRVVAQAVFQHLDVALLEDAERQPSTWKKDAVERKERQIVYGSASRASARWRTSTRQSSRIQFCSTRGCRSLVSMRWPSAAMPASIVRSRSIASARVWPAPASGWRRRVSENRRSRVAALASR